MSSIVPFSGWTTASPYGVVLVGAALLCVICAVASWRRRPLPGAGPGAVVMVAAAVWALFYAFELTTGGLDGKLFWAKTQYLGITVLPVAWFLFAHDYTIVSRPFARWRLILFYLVPFATLVLAATNGLHGLVWSDVSLATSGPFAHLSLAYGPWFWLGWAYSYLFMTMGTILLIVGAYRCQRAPVFRRQVALILLASITPWIGNLLYVTRLLPFDGALDPTPLAFAVAGVLATLSMSRLRLFSLQPTLLPVARGQLLKQMNDGVLVIDANGHVAYANPAASAMLGLHPTDLLGRRTGELPDELSERLARSDDGDEEQRFGITLAEGEQSRDYDVGVSAIRRKTSDKQMSVGCLLVLRDVTEKRGAELALRESEERFKELSSMASESIMIHERGSIVDANAAFVELAGCKSVDELIGRRGFDAVPFTEESRERVIAHVLSDSTDAYEVQIERADGETSWAETNGRKVTYRGRPARLVLIRDISERKQAEEALRESAEQLRHSQRTEAVGRLAGGVAHDFNNMLGVILGHAEVVLNQIDSSEPIYEDMQEISRAAKRSAGITQQLLGFARQQMVVPITLDLNESVEAMVHMLDRLVGEDVELAWEPGGDLGTVVMDPSQIDQILVNLCLNARDAITSAGSVAIETAAAELDESFCAGRSGRGPGAYVRMTVTDTGCGMQPETLKHIFEPFFTTKEAGKGTGLGMATVYGIVRQNNGYIEVESEPGNGTRVDVYLPRHVVPETSDDHPVSDESAATATGTLLVVEDEDALLRLNERVLKGLGYKVLAANNPNEALRLAESYEGELSLVVTDVIMPEINGRELVDRLRNKQPGLRALYISGYAAEVISERGILEKGVFFLQKPFTPQELASNVRAVLKAE